MERPRTPGRPRALAISAVLVLTIGGCGSPVDEHVAPPPPPWEEPVPGAVAVTGWEDHGQPAAPFGPDGAYPWGSPDELIAAMANAFSTMDGIRTTGRVVERHENGTVIGWVRIQLGDRQGPALAGDLRVEMRNDGGSWVVARTEMREHCSRPLVEDECR